MIEGIHSNLTISDLRVSPQNESVYIKNNSKNPGLLLIHAKWCGHCVRFKPKFIEISNMLNRNGNDFPFMAIEDEELQKDTDKLQALKFRGYPTLKFFDQTGRIIGDYQGDRDTSSILQEICSVYHRCILG
jgi:thiol-disulfide isomerase/thioredoxin